MLLVADYNKSKEICWHLKRIGGCVCKVASNRRHSLTAEAKQSQASSQLPAACAPTSPPFDPSSPSKTILKIARALILVP